jgi:hypothetical protein
MKSSSAKSKLEASSEGRSEVMPSKLREVIAKTRYEAPKVISFPFDETKGKARLSQVTMMGNAW